MWQIGLLLLCKRAAGRDNMVSFTHLMVQTWIPEGMLSHAMDGIILKDRKYVFVLLCDLILKVEKINVEKNPIHYACHQLKHFYR